MTSEPAGSGNTSAEDLALAGARMVEAARESVVQVHSGGRPDRRGRWGAGAGFVWAEDGLVVTNLHVVAGTARRGRGSGLKVATRDGRTLDAEAVRGSRSLDLALLRVEGGVGDLPALRAGDSDALRVGELVYAIGHPWGRSGTVTTGVVSGLDATPRPARGPGGYIRSDVSLAPGNSGGPLLNAKGEVVGINAMIHGSQALSIPANAAVLWASGTEGYRPPPARLGVAIRPAGLPGTMETGLVVVGVKDRSPAARANLRVGDVLTEAMGEPLAEVETLFQALSRAGNSVSLVVSRGGKLITVEVPLGAPGQAA